MPSPLDADARRSLLEAARGAARASYSPYSRFRVGAAVRTSRGVFTGTNVENASFGLCLCAERTALASAIAAGARDIGAVAVACIDARSDAAGSELMPCGACRQWLAELAPEAVILIDGLEQIFAVSDLLPAAFALAPRDAGCTKAAGA